MTIPTIPVVPTAVDQVKEGFTRDLIQRLEAEGITPDVLLRTAKALIGPGPDTWKDRDDDLTEAIRAAHPVYTKAYGAYARAMDLVGNRHSKGALVNLVCYLLQTPATPAAKWRVEGKPDPHGDRYDCGRAQLEKGGLTDDELANCIYMADRNAIDLIAWQSAAKERIRWLSRKLVEATEAKVAPAPTEAQVEHLARALWSNGYLAKENAWDQRAKTATWKDDYRNTARALLAELFGGAK